MDLNESWNWKTRKLACRIRHESGNPAGDDLRERFAELAGVDLKEVLSEMKNVKKKKEQTNKLAVDLESDKIFDSLLTRSHILGATGAALTDMKSYDDSHAVSFTQRNIHKQYTLLPKSPPRRILVEIQRERARPLKLPDQEEAGESTSKLQKKLAKQRAARMAAIDRNNKEENAMKRADDNIKMMSNLMATVLPRYEGDKFGSGGEYLESMLYLSRMADSSVKTLRKVEIKEDGDKVDSKTATSALNETNRKTDESNMMESDDFLGHSEQSTATDIGSKLYCAAALCNWARNPANANRLASEGAVRAIMQLFLEPNDRVLTFCSAAFRFMSDHSPLAMAMIDDGAIATISDVIGSNPDEFVCANLAITLVNLTRINNKESFIVEAGVVLALMNIILMRPELSAACARGLYNLTCVDVSYPFIERVIRALVTLSSSGTANVKHICAAALCNLSDLKSVRPRLVEEGTVNVLGTLSRGAETRTRRICAVILQNLSASKSCRVEMTSRNSVTVAYSLSSDQDPIILRAIGLTLSRLAHEPVNSSRIIYESGITALCNIGIKYPTIPGISQPVAAAFQLLSSRSAARINIVQEGSVTAIAALLRQSTDLTTIQHSLLALCNLLIEPDGHLSIVQQGLIITLITLCGHENDIVRDLCALAFFNFSSSEDSRKHIINSGAIVAITKLAGHKNVLTKRRCAAALCNVTSFEQGMARMVGDGIIPCLVSLVLASDIETVHHSCAALCRLCSTEENGRMILEAGAVPNLVKGSLDGDVRTKQFCGAVLSALSFYEICRIPLIDSGIMVVLKTLSALNDEITKQRCLVAYANLSCEESVQVQMVEAGVVRIIADLAESYQEVNYICCAKAMCNLACNSSIRSRIAMDGGVYALLMISMVHSVDKHTKLLCVMALMNLLEDDTVEFMLKEGIVGSVVNLSKIADERIVYLCAQLFNQLSFYDIARVKMSEKTTYMTSLFDMLHADKFETQVLAARTTCNLVLCDVVREKAIAAGAINVLEAGVQLKDDEASLQCLKALFSACSNTNFLVVMSKATLPMTLGTLALKSSDEKYSIIVSILALLVWEKESRPYLQTYDFASLIIKLISKNLQVKDLRWVVTILRFLVFGYKNHIELFGAGMMGALVELHSYGNDENPECLDYIAEIYRMICSSGSKCVEALASSTSVSILKKITEYRVNNPETIYNVAVTMYHFGMTSSECRQATACPNFVDILGAFKNHKKCIEPLSATICVYVFDNKCRSVFATGEVAALLVVVMDNSPNEDALNNAISAVYAMSKIPKCREFLSGPPNNIDMSLIKLAQGDSPRIKANCSRALKNLTSDSSEAIEEGAVAALIAMSLEGKNRNKVGDDASPAQIPALNINRAVRPDCVVDLKNTYWFCDFVVAFGGAAGKGPDPPGPPSMLAEGSGQYPGLSEDTDTSELEGKTKMAFAKMQIPQELRSNYLLTDSDFEIKQDELESFETSDVLDNNSSRSNDGSLNILDAGSKLVDEDEINVRKGDNDSGESPKDLSPNARRESKRIKRNPSFRNRSDSKADKIEMMNRGRADSKAEAKELPQVKIRTAQDVPVSEKASRLGLYN